jgi:hypothetical protein
MKLKRWLFHPLLSPRVQEVVVLAQMSRWLVLYLRLRRKLQYRAETSPGPEAGVLDVTLSGCAGIVDRGNVCGLLAKCLQDVSFAAFTLHIFAYYCFILNSRLFFDRLFL